MTRAEELSGYIDLLSAQMRNAQQSACSVVTMAELSVLTIAVQSGSVKMSRIAEDLNMGLSHVTAVVDKLVDKKLVIRTRCESDRRVVFIAANPEGMRLARQHAQQKLELAQRMLAGLDEKSQDQFLVLMRKIIAPLRV